MKKISIELAGYHSTKQCEKIRDKMQGKTFYNFDIQFGGTAGNNVIIVVGDYQDDISENEQEIELKNFFIAYLIDLM